MVGQVRLPMKHRFLREVDVVATFVLEVLLTRLKNLVSLGLSR